MKKEKEPFLVSISPAIFAIFIMCILLHFELANLDTGFIALGLWAVIGGWNIERLKKKSR